MTDRHPEDPHPEEGPTGNDLGRLSTTNPSRFSTVWRWVVACGLLAGLTTVWWQAQAARQAAVESQQRLRTEPPAIELNHVTERLTPISFQVTNQSAEPIRVLALNTSCGCIDPKMKQRQLLPGDSETVTAEIEMRCGNQAECPFQHHIKLVYSVGDKLNQIEEHAVPIAGRFVQAAYLSDYFVKLKPVSVDGTTVRLRGSVDVFLREDPAVKIVSADIPGLEGTARVEEHSETGPASGADADGERIPQAATSTANATTSSSGNNAAGTRSEEDGGGNHTRHRVTVEVFADQLPCFGSLIIKTDSPTNPILRAQVAAKGPESVNVRAIPDRVAFGVIDAKPGGSTQVSRRVILSWPRESGYRIVSIDAPDCVEIERQPLSNKDDNLTSEQIRELLQVNLKPGVESIGGGISIKLDKAADLRGNGSKAGADSSGAGPLAELPTEVDLLIPVSGFIRR